MSTSKDGLRTLDLASRHRSSQPEVALGVLQGLYENHKFPHRINAGEQCAEILWDLGRYEDAQRFWTELIAMTESDSEQAYARARFITRLGEIQVGPTFAAAATSERYSPADLQSMLEEAEAIFQKNGDVYYIGKIQGIKSTLSIAAGDFRKAEEQLERSQSIMSGHAHSATSEVARRMRIGAAELTGAGSPALN